MKDNDPMEPCKKCDEVHTQCKAHARSGKPCMKPPIRGGAVCRMHGGSAPQVQRMAALRLMELVDPAITTLAREMTSQTNSGTERLRAAENILDRAGYPRKLEVDGELAREQLLLRLQQMRAGTVAEIENEENQP